MTSQADMIAKAIRQLKYKSINASIIDLSFSYRQQLKSLIALRHKDILVFLGHHQYSIDTIAIGFGFRPCGNFRETRYEKCTG
jgi:hypothetical protein